MRLLWTSTGTKDPTASDTLYVEALAAQGTIDTMPEKTLLAFADHGKVSAPLLAETSYAEDIIAKLRHEGLDDNALASRLQREGVGDFDGRRLECLRSNPPRVVRLPCVRDHAPCHSPLACKGRVAATPSALAFHPPSRATAVLLWRHQRHWGHCLPHRSAGPPIHNRKGFRLAAQRSICTGIP